MSKVSVMGHFACKPDKEMETRRMLVRMVDAAREEPGVEIYSYHEGEDGRFWFFALMRDPESMASHGTSDAMRQAMAPFADLIAEPPEMNVLSPIAAIGIEREDGRRSTRST